MPTEFILMIYVYSLCLDQLETCNDKKNALASVLQHTGPYIANVIPNAVMHNKIFSLVFIIRMFILAQFVLQFFVSIHWEFIKISVNHIYHHYQFPEFTITSPPPSTSCPNYYFNNPPSPICIAHICLGVSLWVLLL